MMFEPALSLALFFAFRIYFRKQHLKTTSSTGFVGWSVVSWGD
jgi:hypothetical protein